MESGHPLPFMLSFIGSNPKQALSDFHCAFLQAAARRVFGVFFDRMETSHSAERNVAALHESGLPPRLANTLSFIHLHPKGADHTSDQGQPIGSLSFFSVCSPDDSRAHLHLPEFCSEGRPTDTT